MDGVVRNSRRHSLAINLLPKMKLSGSPGGRRKTLFSAVMAQDQETLLSKSGIKQSVHVILMVASNYKEDNYSICFMLPM